MYVSARCSVHACANMLECSKSDKKQIFDDQHIP